MSGFSLKDIEVADGVVIRVATAGSGTRILLLHGHPHTPNVWRKLGPRLLNISASWLPIFAATGIAASRRAVATISTIPNVRTPGAMEPEAFAEYLRCYDSEATVHAVCEDYRATAGIDLQDDAKDAAQRIWARLLACSLWRERATKVEGSL